jgi:uncharacterized protein with PIN domain
MVVDTSALVAILFDEPDAEEFESAIDADPGGSSRRPPLSKPRWSLSDVLEGKEETNWTLSCW